MKKQQEKEKQETDSSKDSSQPNKNNENTEVPNVKYPGDDPTVSPGEEWEWRGPEDKGSWYNPNTGETLHPDLNHPEPEGPHWDYIPYKNGPQYRILPDGSIIPK